MERQASRHSSFFHPGILLTLPFLLAIGSMFRQAPQAAAQSNPSTGAWNYTARSWQLQNGLPGETVQAFSQTPDGYLWVGSSEGLARFDGAQFTLFTHENTPALIENSVFCLLTGRDGRLWIGTEGGGLVEMHNGAFRTYADADGMTGRFVRDLFEDHTGTIWVATDNGLFRMAGKKFERVDNRPEMPANAFHGIAEDDLGRIWAGAAQLYAISHGQPKEFVLDGTDSQNRVKSILKTEDGSIWVGTVYGLHRLRPGSKRFERVPGVWGTVRTLYSDSSGELWAGTIGQGIFRIPIKTGNGKVTRLTTPSPLVSNTVLSIFADDSKDLWIGTQVGMIRLSPTPVRVLLLPASADSDFGTVSLDTDGSLWAASNQVVHVQDGVAVSHRFPGVGNAHVRNVFRTRDGTLWVGTDGSGVFKVSAQGATQYSSRQGLVNNFVRGFLEARDGSLWIATDAGLSHLDRSGFHSIAMDNGLIYYSTRSIIEDRAGDIWIGTDGGLSHFHNGRPVYDAATEALKGEKIWAEHEDSDGGLWFGTRTCGLLRFRDGSLTRYTTANGLASDSIFAILEDSRKHFWISSPVGVMLLNRDDLDAQAQVPRPTLSMRLYRADDSDIPTQFYGGTQPAAAITPDGEVWFPTNRGLWRIRPTEADPSTLSHLAIGSVSVDGKQVLPTDSITLAAGASRLDIAYEPLMLRSQENLRFRYRMEGFDKDWIRVGSQQRSVTYTNLPSGSYKFVVEAWEIDYPDRVARATMALVKMPYFYRTPWFIALCALLLGLLSILAYQVRMKQVHGRFKAVLAERSRLAREMHDTLIQGCASVSAMLEAASTCDMDDSETRQHMIDFANTQIRSTMDEARQAVWNLRIGERAPSDLATCLAQMAERLSREYGVRVDCHIPDNAFPIGQQETHELMMVVREAFFNAILHGHPKTIVADLSFSSEFMEMVLSDDGLGFDPEVARWEGHYGLQGMRERVHRLGGVLKIHSAPRQGTKIRVTIPKAGLCCNTEGKSLRSEPVR
jgi:ligand-binding sensor domain-containing protein/signal transduction histidine kinase